MSGLMALLERRAHIFKPTEAANIFRSLRRLRLAVVRIGAEDHDRRMAQMQGVISWRAA